MLQIQNSYIPKGEDDKPGKVFFSPEIVKIVKFAALPKGHGRMQAGTLNTSVVEEKCRLLSLGQNAADVAISKTGFHLTRLSKDMLMHKPQMRTCT